MKNLALAALVLIATLAITTSAQRKSVVAANNQPITKSTVGGQTSSKATRARVLRPAARVAEMGEDIASAANLQARAKSGFASRTDAARTRRSNDDSDNPSPRFSPAASGDSKAPISDNVSYPNSVTPSAVSMASTQVYRVGHKDVLDIQLAENPTRDSTLFTVLDGGLLEYPLAGPSIAVVGLTTAEIAALLRQRIKIFDNPAVVVNVRDYASHTVNISGFVSAPGTKSLRREAVPLYALLAEALVLPEAARATITRQGRPPMVIDLKDARHSSTLVIAGDVIKVLGTPASPTEFFFVGGAINSPGQKPFHAGLTLTQAILASGGLKENTVSRVRVSRQADNGRLITEEYNLRKIQTGKLPDPVLQKGDRIEVISAN